MASTPQFDPTQPFQEEAAGSTTPVFDSSKPFTEETPSTPVFDPSKPFTEEGSPSREDLISQEKEKILQENQQSNLGFAGQVAGNILNPFKSIPAVGGIAKSLVYDPTKALVQDVGDIATGQPNAISNLGKDVSAGAARGFQNVYQGVTTGIPHFLKTRGTTLTDADAQKMAEENISNQEARENLAAVGGTPERAEAFSGLLDPTNVPLLGEGIAAKALGEVATEGIGKAAASGIVSKMAEGGAEALSKAPVGRGAKVASIISNGLGKATGVVGDVSQKATDFVSSAANGILPKALADTGLGKSLSLGALGHLMGFSVPTSFVLSSLPSLFTDVSKISTAASKVIMDGEGSVPFFRSLASDPNIQGRAKDAALMMDKTGMGRVLEGIGRTLAVPLDHPGVPAAFAVYGTLTSGGDPDATSQAILGAYGIPMLGHALTEPFYGGSHAAIQGRQIGDVVNYWKSLGDTQQQAWLQRLDSHPEGKGSAADELIGVAQLVRNRPGAGVDFVVGDSTPRFDPDTGKVEMSLSGPNALPHILAHEFFHEAMSRVPEGQDFSKRSEILSHLIGNPETGQNGFLVRYNPDKTATPTPEFQKFIDGYMSSLKTDLSTRKDSQGNLINSPAQVEETLKRYSNPKILAEEWLAEQAAPLWSSYTGKGELGFARIARQGAFGKLFSDTILKNTGTGLVSKAASIFGIPESNIRTPKWGSRDSGLPKSLRLLLTNAVHSGLIHDPAKETVYSSDFENHHFNLKDIRQNPEQTRDYFGSSNLLKWNFNPDTGRNEFGGFRTEREASKLSEQQAKVISDAIINSKPTDPDDVQWREQTDAKGNVVKVLSGKTLSPEVRKLIGDSGKFNAYQLQILDGVLSAIKNNESIRNFYQTPGKKGRLMALEGGWRTSKPYGIKISTPEGGKGGANILIQALDFKRFEENYRVAIKRNQKSVKPVDIPSFKDATDQLVTVMQNYERGYKGDGTLSSNKVQPTEPPAGLLSENQKNFVNELLGLDLTTNQGHNMFRSALKEEGLKTSKSAFIDFRLDRMNKISSDSSIPKVNLDYPNLKFNYSPEADKEKLNGWMDTSGKITAKGADYHDVAAAKMTGITDPVQASNSLFEKGQMRTRTDMGRLYLSNESGKPPSAKQIKEAKDLAIENGLTHVVYDSPNGAKLLWAKSQESGEALYSPEEKPISKEQEIKNLTDKLNSLPEPSDRSESQDVHAKVLQDQIKKLGSTLYSPEETPKSEEKGSYYRGGSESSMPKNGTAQDVVDYETKELGNKITPAKGIDLKSIPSNSLQWVTKTRKDARQYGKAVPVVFENHKVIASDLYGGLLVQKLNSSNKELYSPEVKPAFYSKVEDTVDSLPERFTVGQLKAALAPEKGIKPEELQWMNFESFLNGKGSEDKVRKSEVQKWAQESKVQVNEVVKDDIKQSASVNRKSKYALPEVLRAANEAGDTEDDLHLTLANDGDAYRALTKKFPELKDKEDWAEIVSNDVFGGTSKPTQLTKFNSPKLNLPGGKNYRELLFTMPHEDFKPSEELAALKQKHKEIFNKRENPASIKEWRDLDNQLGDIDLERRNLENKERSAYENKDKFQSSHFNEPNVLAHVRFNERTDAEGKKVLFLEEVQSDWHQNGRKSGYQTQDVWEVQLPHGMSRLFNSESEAKEFASTQPKIRGIENLGKQGVPNAPFKKTWHELVMKRMLDWAVKNGFDKVAWTTGEQQAARYDLSKQVDSISWAKYNDDNLDLHVIHKDGKEEKLGRYTLKELPAIVGKDLSQKINTDFEKGERNGDYSGLDLKVGGEGMKGFYDKILPEFMNKYGKKFGAEVKPARIQVGPSPGEVQMRGRNETAHSISITPQLKEAVLGKGQPLFSPEAGKTLPSSGLNATSVSRRERTKQLLARRTLVTPKKDDKLKEAVTD